MIRWHDDITGFVSIVVERLEGVFLVLRPEDAIKEKTAVRLCFGLSTIVIIVEMIMLAS